MNMDRLKKEYEEIKDFDSDDFKKIQKELSKLRDEA